MIRSLALLLPVAALFAAAENSWDKVKELKSGTEIRMVVSGSPGPVEGKLDEVRDDVIVVVVKNEQKAFRKDVVQRLDARPKGTGNRMTTETRTKETPADTTPPAGMNHGANVPGQSVSNSVSFGGKAGFETVYRRTAGHSMTSEPAKK